MKGWEYEYKDLDKTEIKKSIEESLKEKYEITLPGLGVFFEILWINSNEEKKEYILNILKENMI